jgi:hypothetical protein
MKFLQHASMVMTCFIFSQELLSKWSPIPEAGHRQRRSGRSASISQQPCTNTTAKGQGASTSTWRAFGATKPAPLRSRRPARAFAQGPSKCAEAGPHPGESLQPRARDAQTHRGKRTEVARRGLRGRAYCVVGIDHGRSRRLWHRWGPPAESILQAHRAARTTDAVAKQRFH